MGYCAHRLQCNKQGAVLWHSSAVDFRDDIYGVRLISCINYVARAEVVCSGAGASKVRNKSELRELLGYMADRPVRLVLLGMPSGETVNGVGCRALLMR